MTLGDGTRRARRRRRALGAAVLALAWPAFAFAQGAAADAAGARAIPATPAAPGMDSPDAAAGTGSRADAPSPAAVVVNAGDEPASTAPGSTELGSTELGATELAPIAVTGARGELQDSGVVIRVPVTPLSGVDLADLLGTLPGVQVRSAGGLGAFSEASLRGSSGRQVRVLLDGLPLDTGGGESTSLSLVSPLLLEGVDVYQGRVPVGLGSGLAGTINLRSRTSLVAPVVGTAAYGSFGQRQLDLAAQPADNVIVALGGRGADNDFDILNPYKPFDPSDPDRRDEEARRNAATRQYYGLARWRGPLELSAHAVDDHQEIPTRDNAPSQAALDTNSFALSAATPPDAAWQAALSHRYTREHYTDPGSQIGVGAQDTHSDTHRSLATLGRRFGPQVQDTASAEYTHYAARDPRGDVPTGSADRLALSNGLAAQTGDALKFNGSLQAGWSRDSADGARDDGPSEYWQFEPAVGSSWRFEDACLAAANLGRRQRLPTFFERYGDRGLFRGNPALRRETATYADAGLRCTPGGRWRRAELTFFGQDLHDPISPTYTAQGVGRSVNSERGLIYGAELDNAGQFAGFGWQLGGTWQHTEDRSEVRAARGQQLPGRFTSQLDARVERAWQRLVFWYALRYEAGQYYDSANLLKAPEMQRHDVGVRGSFARLGWSLQAQNLADDRFQQFNGYPTPGRRFLLSLSWPATPAGALDR